MTTKLCMANLQKLAVAAELPAYDRSKVESGVVHIGPSHFARGHLFKYLDDILKTDPRWGVTAINVNTSNPNPAAVRDILAQQDYLYSVVEQSAKGHPTRIIGSLKNIIVASEEPRKALDALTSPTTKLITMTVSQSGYGHDPSTGLLDFERDDIKACMNGMDDPSTTVGYLVAAFEQRMKNGAPPVTILSCDNLTGNGGILRNVVLAYAAEKSKDLRKYIEENATFPSTMVDRIVPGTTQTNVFNSQTHGIGDAWPIVTEDFSQFAIERHFAGDMPDFESVGAIVADDVTQYEEMKIRMLNGAHMALGCVGKLAGYEYVHEAMQDPFVEKFIDGFMSEAALTLSPLQGVDYKRYKEQLKGRLHNHHMKDELVRLARNGTQKIGSRVLDTSRDLIARDQPLDHMAFTTAAWIQYLKGSDINGDSFDINDSNAVNSGLQNIARKSNGSPEPVIAASKIFGHSLQANHLFISQISRHLHNIQSMGMLGAIQEISYSDNIVQFPQPSSYSKLTQG